jgi:hypothetical protein
MSILLPESFTIEPPPGEDQLPYSDGEPIESEIHAKQQTLLVSSLARLYQGVETGWLRWLDAQGRKTLPTDDELSRTAEQQLAEQVRAREDAERRLAEALAEIALLKASRS